MATRIPFTKPARTTSELLCHLLTKGLTIRDEQNALHALSLIGYYRLLIYMRPLQDSRTRRFFSGITFDDVLALYDFDRRLRLVCLDAIERIEVAMRAAITSSLAPTPSAGPHFYLDARHFTSTHGHASFMRAVCDPNTLKHQPVVHYHKTYDDPAHAPIWALLEAVTFGSLSHLFASLHLPHRKSVARVFGFDEKVLVNWFRSINLLRNVCAHHARLWNKNNLVNVPIMAKSLKSEFPAQAEQGRLGARAVTLTALLAVIDPASDWKHRFKTVVLSCPTEPLRKAGMTLEIMGFSPGWEMRPFWN